MRRRSHAGAYRTRILAVLVCMCCGCYRDAGSQQGPAPVPYAREKHNDAVALLERGDPEGALAAATAAAEADPAFVPALHLRGIALAKLGRIQEAADAMAAAAERAPGAGEIRLVLGIFLEKAGNETQAREAYAAAAACYAAQPDLAAQPESQINHAIAIFLSEGKTKGLETISSVLDSFPGYGRAKVVQQKMRETDRAYFYRWASQDAPSGDAASQ